MDNRVHASSAPLAKLIDAIYLAALDTSAWQLVLAQICEACNIDQCTLFFYDGINRAHSYAAAARQRLDRINLFLDHFIQQQVEQLHGPLAPLQVGQLVSAEHLVRQTGKAFGDIVGDQYLRALWPRLNFQAGAVLVRTEHSCAAIGLQKFFGKPAISSAELCRVNLLIPHLIKAISIHQAWSRQLQTRLALEALLMQANFGLALLDKNLGLSLVNSEAKRILQEHDLAIQTWLAVGQLPEADVYVLPFHQGRLRITLAKLPPGTATESKTYLMLLQDAQRNCQVSQDYLHQAYGLTKAECDLIGGLVNGASLSQAASQRSVTKETARWQLKHIMQKTETHSQTELTRLMLALTEA